MASCHEPLDLTDSEFDPLTLVFDRAQYEAELQRLLDLEQAESDLREPSVRLYRSACGEVTRGVMTTCLMTSLSARFVPIASVTPTSVPSGRGPSRIGANHDRRKAH